MISIVHFATEIIISKKETTALCGKVFYENYSWGRAANNLFEIREYVKYDLIECKEIHCKKCKKIESIKDIIT